jgi:RNA polymerase-binding transcription factor DksA
MQVWAEQRDRHRGGGYNNACIFMLSHEQLRQLEVLIDEQERALRGKLRLALHDRFAGTESGTERMAGDRAEQSIAEFLEGVDAGELMHEANALRAIDAARAALEEGRYGVCVDCQGAIGFKRLLVLPTAARCLACQEHAERANWQGGETRH